MNFDNVPFELSADPFYSESNLAHLRRGAEALNSGKGVEHELVEDDENDACQNSGVKSETADAASCV